MREPISSMPPASSSHPASAAERFARRARGDAIGRGEAVLVGTVDGVVEWTDGAWTRLTGFPLDETLEKPITHFLDRAGLERELVEFVAHNFLEGRSCTVALPFDTFDGRHIDVRLEVDRWRDGEDDTTRFIAVARDVTGEVDGTNAAERGEALEPPSRRTRGAAALLEPIVLAAADEGRPDRSTVRAFDVHLAPTTGLFATPTEPIPGILGALLQASRAATDAGPIFISIVAGALEAGRSHHSLVHPIPNRGVAARTRDGCYVEVHYTAPHLDAQALAALRAGAPGSSARERAIARALSLAEDAGLDLDLDSTPGCGTQALLVLDRAAPEAARR